MPYKKINVELIVAADGAEAVVAALNSLSRSVGREARTLSVVKSRLWRSSIGEHGSDRRSHTQSRQESRLPWLSGPPERTWCLPSAQSSE